MTGKYLAERITDLMKKSVKLFLITLAVVAISACQSPSTQKTPKNVILIIGDGTGFNQFQSASLYLHGEADKLVSQNFPIKLAASTFSADGDGYDPQMVLTDFEYLLNKPTDSAASGTALSTGVKTHNGFVGMDTLEQPLTNMFELAEKAGKATGVVTSVPFAHATPATFVAHNKSRGHYKEIAHEMIFQSATDIIIGCGHPYYNDNGEKLPEPDFKYWNSEDWQLVQEGSAGADADGDGDADPWVFIDTREDFIRLASGDAPDRLLGIAMAASTLQANRGGKEEQTEPFTPPLNDNVPALSDISLAALNVLDNDPDGFYLMIEGGAIDWACHANHGPRLVEEAVDLEKAIKAVCEWVEKNSSWDETLVVITADHETGYLTGPESGEKITASGETRSVFTPLQSNGAGNMPEFEFHSGGHSNSLVPVFAKGAAAEGLARMAQMVDSLRGPYIDNTDIANYLKSFVK